ncbi:hypothetical protein D3C87_1527730 [compost metagenome]
MAVQHLAGIEQEHAVIGVEITRQRHSGRQFPGGQDLYLRVGQGDIAQERDADLNEILEQLRIVKASGILAQIEQRFVAVHLSFDNQFSLQLDEVNRQLQQSRSERNGFALEPVGETAAVPAFLMVQDQPRRILHRVQGHQ